MASVLAIHGGGVTNDEITRAAFFERSSAGVYALSPDLRGPPNQEEEASLLYPADPDYYEPLLPRRGIPVRSTKPPVIEQAVPRLATGSVQEAFTQGWLDGGGSSGLLPLVHCIIGKESSWNVNAIGAGLYHGLGQFLLSTWNSVGGGDWRDAYTQGVNMARNWLRSNPAGQWPKAYRECGGA